MKKIVYFDNNATTQVSPSVFEAMVPYLTEHYGNASSAYRIGRRTREAVEQARAQVAALLGCEPREIVFTGCATESNNTAIHSALQTTGHRHVVVSAVEHSAIKNHAEYLERLGYGVTYLPVAADGTLTVKQVEEALRDDTAIVSVMWANNETGVTFPVAEIGELCRSRGVLFHTDAVQVVGKLPINLAELKIDFLSLAGHKFHAPKGVGALYVRRRVKFVPYVIGGHQEKGKRGGTENVSHIVGLGQAAVEAQKHLAEETTRVRALRDKFENTVLASIPDTFVNGNREQRTPNTSSLAFSGIEAEALLIMLDQYGVCASAGSACTTGSVEISHVLQAMGVPKERAVGTLRFSFSAYNTEAEVDYVLGILPAIVAKLRAESASAVKLKERLDAGENITEGLSLAAV
jgi:cysteine desulfurase